MYVDQFLTYTKANAWIKMKLHTKKTNMCEINNKQNKYKF